VTLRFDTETHHAKPTPMQPLTRLRLGRELHQ